MERLKLLPLSQDSVEERVAAFRNFSDEVRSTSKCFPKTPSHNRQCYSFIHSKRFCFITFLLHQLGAPQLVWSAARHHEHLVHTTQTSEDGASRHARTIAEEHWRQRYGEKSLSEQRDEAESKINQSTIDTRGPGSILKFSSLSSKNIS